MHSSSSYGLVCTLSLIQPGSHMSSIVGNALLWPVKPDSHRSQIASAIAFVGDL